MVNENVRNAMKCNGVPQWKVGAFLGVSEQTMIRWLRFPLPAEKEARIMEAIEKLAAEKESAR